MLQQGMHPESDRFFSRQDCTVAESMELDPCEAQAECVVRSSLVVEVSEVEVYGVCGVCGVRHRSRFRREGWEETVGIDRHIARN